MLAGAAAAGRLELLTTGWETMMKQSVNMREHLSELSSEASGVLIKDKLSWSCFVPHAALKEFDERIPAADEPSTELHVLCAKEVRPASRSVPSSSASLAEQP